jgi:tetratricopeptide (TPR) repeat protein
VKWTAILVLVLVALALAARFGLDFYADSEVEKKIDEVSKADRPVHFLQLSPAKVPSDQNAAVWMKAAFELLKETTHENDLDKVTEWHSKNPFEPFPDELKKLAESLLKKSRYAQALELLREAAKLDKCNFDLQWHKGFVMELPHLAQIRSAVRLLRAEAFVQFQNGFPAEALSTCVVAIRLAGKLQYEPILISHLVQLACLGTTLEVLQAFMKAGDFTEEQYRELMNALYESDQTKSLENAFEGELCFGLDTFSRASAEVILLFETTDTAPSLRLLCIPVVCDVVLWFARPVLKLDKCEYISLMTKFLNALPGGDVAVIESLDREVQGELPFYCFITRLLMPALLGCKTATMRKIADRDLGYLAMALRIYRLRTGAYPDSLYKLGPGIISEIPNDPFTDKLYIYEPSGTGFKLYSVGENKVDDGGVPCRENPKKGDLVWEIER